jgi:hypothetical protein
MKICPKAANLLIYLPWDLVTQTEINMGKKKTCGT